MFFLVSKNFNSPNWVGKNLKETRQKMLWWQVGFPFMSDLLVVCLFGSLDAFIICFSFSLAWAVARTAAPNKVLALSMSMLWLLIPKKPAWQTDRLQTKKQKKLFAIQALKNEVMKKWRLKSSGGNVYLKVSDETVQPVDSNHIFHNQSWPTCFFWGKLRGSQKSNGGNR